MRFPFTPSKGPTGLRRTRRASQRSFVLPLCARLLLIALAVVAVTPADPEEFQSTAAFPWAWNSGEGDVDGEIANADPSPFADTLFQHDHQLVVALVRSKHFSECAMLDRDSDAHTRVRTRAPPTPRGSSGYYISRPCSLQPTSASANPAHRRDDTLREMNGVCRWRKAELRARHEAAYRASSQRLVADRRDTDQWLAAPLKLIVPTPPEGR